MKKTKIVRKVKKVSHTRSLMIMATWPIAIGAILGFSYLTYSLVESKYFDVVDQRNLEKTEVNQRGIQLSNEEFGKIVDQMQIDEDFSKYSAEQILDLSRDSASNFHLTTIFNLTNFSSKYPFLKLNINPINKSDVENDDLVTKVVNNNLINVVFSAHDQFTNKTYSKVHSIRGFNGKGDIPFINFNIDQQKSAFILQTAQINQKWNALSLIQALNSEYKNTKDAKKTLEKFGSFLFLDSNDNLVNFPEGTHFDFETDQSGNIIFKNIDDSSGNLWISFGIFDSNKTKIRTFDLKVSNLLDYAQVTNYLNNLIKTNDELIILKDEKIQEIVAQNVSLSTFLVSQTDHSSLFDISKLQNLFTNSSPNFNVRLFGTNIQMDRIGEVELMVQIDFKAKQIENLVQNQSTPDNISVSNLQQNPPVQVQKTLQNQVSLFQDAGPNNSQNSSQENLNDAQTQENYRKFNFIYTLKPFKNLAQRYLDSVIKDNDLYIVRQKFNYLDGAEIINNLRSINASFYSFQENRNTSKGLEIVNLESSPTYDSLTSQRAIVTWFKDFFKDSLTFPSWKKTDENEKPEEVLSKIFAKMNDIINSKQIFSYGVKYNLFFESSTGQLTITISIYDRFNKILGQKDIKISGLSPTNPQLLLAKENQANFFIDGSGGYNVGESDESNLFHSEIKGLKSITNPQVSLGLDSSKRRDKKVKLVRNSGILYPSLNDNYLKLFYKSDENFERTVAFEENTPFFYSFSVQNNLEPNQSKIVLKFITEQNGTSDQQTNQDPNLIWVKKLSKKSDLTNLNSDSIPDNTPVWLIGVSKKAEIETSSTNTNQNGKIIGILPVDEGQFTNFVLSYNALNENLSSNSGGTQTQNPQKIIVKIATSKSKDQPQIELEKNFWSTQNASSTTSGSSATSGSLTTSTGPASTSTTVPTASTTSASTTTTTTTTTSSPASSTTPTTPAKTLTLHFGDEENNKNSDKSEVLFRYFIQFNNQFSKKEDFEKAFATALK
ncbi:P110/LppT family adhesin N-terminal domain [Mesomycoplasma ovipneumoniae]|uniref:P110/LppT family adhesin N-terminal domain n=1 Tax=Mesomycoplasma ovipneumoniae TaxID=29562 RepID=UPI0026E20F56|nr:P110/LppT family adhesin N-terminal domain [Mesomycoplasma ovipneumoniae]MDO6829525.1 P110/LppT family adhesin N-terminal domain [Mesomycoplasma ovipneumoniae]